MVTRTTDARMAERMMTNVESSSGGLSVSFADGLVSLVPWDRLAAVRAQCEVLSVAISSPYELTIRTRDGQVTGIPWDFVRHFGDREHRQRNAELASQGRGVLARRLRTLRCESKLSQQELAERSGLDALAIERLEAAAQEPTLEVIRRLAMAIGRPVQELMVDDPASRGT